MEEKKSEDTTCLIEQCDIFDFMANHVGLTVIHPGGFEATNKLLESCYIDKNSKVLDIGCGTGTTSLLLAQKYGCHVVGLDLSQDLLNQATALVRRTRLEHTVSFRVGDALNMPFFNEEFDIAIGQAVLSLLVTRRRPYRKH